MRNNGGFIGHRMGVARSFTLVDSSYCTNDNNVTVPLTAKEGDIAIICDNVDTASTLGAPTGWEIIRVDSISSNVTGGSFYKILTTSDVGATVSSYNTSTSNHFMLCVVFRPNIYTEITVVNLNDVEGEATTGNPASQTLTCSQTLSLPVIGCFAFMQRGGNNAWALLATEPVSDGEIIAYDETAKGVIRFFYKFFNEDDTPIDLTGDMNDNGAQVAQSWYMTFGYRSFIKTGIRSLNSYYLNAYT